MTVEKFISTKKLDEYIRGELAELLRTNAIYKLNHYGWLDADTPNPEFIGHALPPPLGWDFAFANTFAGNPLSNFPPLQPWQKFLSISHSDFEGLMEAARLSIGLALFHGALLKDEPFADESLFRVYRMASIINLSMASDRIRDILVAAIFQKSTKEYAKGKYSESKRSLYTTPFCEAASVLTRFAELSNSLVQLSELANKIFELRQQRNEIVHEIATHLGWSEKRRLNDQSVNISKTERLKKRVSVDRDLVAVEHRARNTEKIEMELEAPIKWYRLLIMLSNCVFIAVHTAQPA